MLRARGAPAGQRYIAVCSGANMNFDRLRHVAERADLGAGREALLAVEIPEQLGSFLRFCEALGEHVLGHFIDAKRAEWDGYRAQVTQWEIDRYLEAY